MARTSSPAPRTTRSAPTRPARKLSISEAADYHNVSTQTIRRYIRTGRLLAEDCAADHWSPVLGGRREGAQWRAPCPVCNRARRLEYDAPGPSVRWNIFCPCDRETVRKALTDLLPECMPKGRNKVISAADLKALALVDMPAKSRQLAMLELAGIPTNEALDSSGSSAGTEPAPSPAGLMPHQF